MMSSIPNTQIKLEIGDIIIMKKPHACGEPSWEVNRLGVDIGLRCTKCNHPIIMDRIELYKKMKKKESRIDAKN